MKRGSIPLWLLRDLPALVGLAWSFWPLMIMVISSGRRAMLGKPIKPQVYDCIMHMLPIAEAQLHYVLCRQAYRALGWNVRDVRREVFAPITDWSRVAVRFEVYRLQMMDLRAASTQFTDGLRETYRTRTSVDANAVRAARASTGALRAAQSGRAGVARPQEALMLSSARSARPSKHARGLTNARGPPATSRTRNPTPIPQRHHATENALARLWCKHWRQRPDRPHHAVRR